MLSNTSLYFHEMCITVSETDNGSFTFGISMRYGFLILIEAALSIPLDMLGTDEAEQHPH
jgi:hypothetical protein